MTDDEILATFEPQEPFLFRYGADWAGGRPSCLIKLCFTSTAMGPMARVLHELSLRPDCEVVKMDQAPLPNGMVRGRCFLKSPEAVAEVWLAHKVTPELLCTIQDDGFTERYRSA